MQTMKIPSWMMLWKKTVSKIQKEKTTEPMNEYKKRLHRALLKQKTGGGDVGLNAFHEEGDDKAEGAANYYNLGNEESSLMTM